MRPFNRVALKHHHIVIAVVCFMSNLVSLRLPNLPKLQLVLGVGVISIITLGLNSTDFHRHFALKDLPVFGNSVL